MLREALHVALSVIMKNHVYTFNNKIKKQIKGGPIRLKLTAGLGTTIHDLVGPRICMQA